MNISRPACRAFSPQAPWRQRRMPPAPPSCAARPAWGPSDRARPRRATCSDNGSAFPTSRSSGASTTTFPSTTSGMPRRGTGSTSKAALRGAIASCAIATSARCWPSPPSSATSRISGKRRRWSAFGREHDRVDRSNQATSDDVSRVNTGGEVELLLSCAWLATVCWLSIRAVDQRRLFARLEPSSVLMTEDAPHVTVIVPVRDESATIAGCLQSLLSQQYPASRFDVVVVDDESTDGTPHIVQSLAETYAQLSLLRSPALPRGATGKSHACSIGARVVPAHSEWLCFVDADVRAEPLLLASAVRAAADQALDLLSLAPRHELRSFAERLVLPCGLFTLAFSRDLRERQAQDGADVTVSGPFLLIRRKAYDAVGGHAAVGSAIAEDVALARILKRHGFKVVLRSGDRLLSARMYTGWRTVWS